MKTAKKVLSIVLAVMMAFGACAVAATANGNPATATHRVTMKLTAEVNGVEYDSDDDAIPVNPGDTVNISLWVNNNYYAGVFNTQIFYTADLLDPKQKSNLTNLKAKKLVVWNEDGVEYLAGTTATRVTTYWSYLVDEGKATGWPKNDQGEIVMDQDNKHFTLFYSFPDPNNVEETPIISETNEKFLTYPLYVPDTAEAGDTYTIEIPEGCIRDANNTAGSLYITEYADGVVGGDTTMYFGEDQYFDLSQANLNFQVAGATELDYSGLQTQYNAVKDTVTGNYTSPASFIAARDAAKAMLDNRDAADQAAITTATTNLSNAFAALVLKNADYTALDAAIAAMGTTYIQSNYTAASWSNYAAAVAQGVALSRSLKITEQATVDAKTNAITSAAALLAMSGADYSALTNALAAAAGKTQSWYTTNSWSALSTAVASGNAISSGLDVTHQAEINAAAEAINNAIANLVEADASYTALDAAIALANSKSSDDYTAQSWAAMQSMLTAAQGIARTYKAKDQSIINTAEQNLSNAIESLVQIGGANYSELIAEIAAGTEYSSDKYTSASWSAYSTVLQAAQQMVNDNNLNATQQAQVDSMKANLIQAKANLVKVGADYTRVDTALATEPSDLTLYTAATVANLTAAKNSVVRGLDFTHQSEVNTMSANLEAAIAGLEFKAADTAALDAAISSADAVNTALYVPSTVTPFTAALTAAKNLRNKTPLDIRDQTDINNAATALANAQAALAPLGADYTSLEAAISDYESRTASWYTATSWGTATTAYNAAKSISTGAVLPISQQSVIDNAAAALENALDNLVEADADYTDVDSAILRQPSAARRAVYTTESLATLDNAIAAVVRDLKIKDQSTVDGYATAINNAVDNLVFKPFDYTTTNGYINNWNNLQSDEDLYTASSWAAAKAVFDNLVMNYTQENLAAAMIQQNNCRNAINNLVLAGDADYSEVTEAQQAAAALQQSDYTATSWANLQTALGDVVLGLNANHQSEVDAMAQAITDAIDDLVELADFAALDAIILEANALDENHYTADSWAILDNAVSAGASLSRQITVDQQTVVDNAVQAIRNAINGLQVKSNNSAITSIVYTPSESQVNDFAVRVNGRAEKVRFLDPNLNTWTYNRYHDMVSIVSYDENNNVVNSLDRNLAYEIWTITVNMPINKEMRAVARFNGVFESVDLAYKMTVTLLEPVLDTVVHSMALAALSGPKGKVVATVTTGMDVQAVRFITELGETCTYSASTATVQDNKLVFTGNTWNKNPGENETTVMIKVKGVWQYAGTIVYVVE